MQEHLRASASHSLARVRDEVELTHPEGRDGRLGLHLLGRLLNLIITLAHLLLILTGEFGVAPTLLGCLRLRGGRPSYQPWELWVASPIGVQRTIVIICYSINKRKGDERDGEIVLELSACRASLKGRSIGQISRATLLFLLRSMDTFAKVGRRSKLRRHFFGGKEPDVPKWGAGWRRSAAE